MPAPNSTVLRARASTARASSHESTTSCRRVGGAPDERNVHVHVHVLVHAHAHVLVHAHAHVHVHTWFTVRHSPVGGA